MKRFFSALAVLACLVSCEKTETPSIEIDGKTEYEVNESAVVVNVKIRTNQQDWGYDLGAASSWIKASDETANGVSLTIAANGTYDDRSADITFYAPASTKEAKATVRISQKGKQMEPEMILEPAGYVKVEAAAGKLDIKVNTNQGSWGYSMDADWITCTKTETALSLTIAENKVDESRKAVIKFFSPESSPILNETITVEQAPADIQYDKEDLSANGTANSYVIYHKGPYSFNAKVRGNGATTSKLSAPQPLEPAGAKLVWQTEKGMISNVKYDSENGTIEFTASRTPGNALIAATDSKGTIIWSWHIWYPEIQLEGIMSSEGSEYMNVNLGALNANHNSIKSYGLLYQWGRKDPFPGSPVMSGGNMFTKSVDVYDANGEVYPIGASSMSNSNNNHLQYSIEHPDVCLSNNAQYSQSRDWLAAGEEVPGRWGNPDGNVRTNAEYKIHGSKSYYDPCPPGWRVPHIDALSFITSTKGMIWVLGEDEHGLLWGHLFGEATFAAYDQNQDGKVDMNDYHNGWYLTLNEDTKANSYFPSTTRYDGQYAVLMGSVVGYWANYWTNAPSETMGMGQAMTFGIKAVTNYSTMELKDELTASGVSSGSCADAYAVRCIKE